MPFLLVLAGLLSIAVLAGRTLVGAIRFRPLLRFTPLNAAACAVLGLGVLTVLYAWLTTAGLAAPAIVVVVLLLQVAALGFVRRREGAALLRPRGPLVHWLALAGVAAAAALMALLPALRTGSFAVDNDVHTYGALSEWLQGRGFGTPAAWDPESPVTYFPDLWQRKGDPLGASFLLAFVQAATRAPSSLIAYPPVSSWGLVLAALALAFLARWALRLSLAASFLTGWLFALVPSPDHWGHHHGFLQQTLALPVLLLSVAVLSRPAALVRAGATSALLVALLLASLVLVYLPFVPLFLAAALLPAWIAARRSSRARTERRFFLWLALAAVLAVAFSLGALVRTGSQIGAMTGAVPGSHIGFTGRQFVELALGARVPGLEGSRGALPLLALALCGIPRLWRRPRAGSMATVLALLFVSMAYYALVAKDPWSGGTGHTWSLFKLIQWAYPLILLLQVSGLAWLKHRVRVGERRVLGTAGVLALGFLPVHWAWSGELGQSLRRLLRAERPIEVLGPVKQRLLSLPGGPLFVVNRSADVDRWLGIYAALLAYPRPIVADWEGSVDVRADFGAEPWRRRLLELGPARGPVPVVLGPAADRDGLTDLGAGFALVRDLRPRVVHVRNPDELRGADDRPPFWLGPGRTKVAIFSGDKHVVELKARIRGTVPSEVGVVTLGPAFAGQPLRAGLKAVPERAVTVGADSTLRLSLTLEPGLTRVVLRARGTTDTQGAILEDVRIEVR